VLLAVSLASWISDLLRASRDPVSKRQVPQQELSSDARQELQIPNDVDAGRIVIGASYYTNSMPCKLAVERIIDYCNGIPRNPLDMGQELVLHPPTGLDG